MQIQIWKYRRSLSGAGALLIFSLIVLGQAGCGTDKASAAEAQGAAPEDFDRLCELYRKAAQRDVDSYVRDKQLFAAIEQQLPDIYRHYSYLSEAKGERVHGLIKELAGQAGNTDWDCPIIHQYHTGQLSELAGSDQRN